MTFWTEERKTEAERLWRAGWSADAIAAQLNAVSRNAVIGLLHRKKLARRTIALAAATPKAASAWSAMSQTEKLTLIREGLAENLSAKEIAATAGVPPQTVVSYGNKHGLRFLPPELAAERRTIHAGNIVARIATRAEEKPASLPVAPMAPVVSRNVALLDLKAEDCRYLAGDPRDPAAGFCGHPRQPGSSYCAWHHRACYHRPDPTRRADLAAEAAA